MSTSLKSEFLKKYNLADPFSIYFFFAGVVAIIFLFISGINSILYFKKSLEDKQIYHNGKIEKSFNGFNTDISKTSISLNKIYNKGPNRGAIPAIMNPQFLNPNEVILSESEQGILVKFTDSVQRFYPIKILVWHEIVNDQVESFPFVVTYSPLTGTAAVFERKIKDETLVFDVSGLLYESNLLMFDTNTESFWSQNERRAVVGDYNNQALKLVDFDLVSYEYAKKSYPNLKVLSEQTGFIRDYSNNPYAEYLISDVVYPEFGISKVDTKYKPKEMVYSIPYDDKVYSFLLSNLDEKKVITFKTPNYVLTVKKAGEEINAYLTFPNNPTLSDSDLEPLPGYYEMWYSWAVKHASDGILE